MYIDGFVIPLPADRREDYLALARMAAEVFLEHGATRVVECWGDDVPPGKLTSFPLAVQTREDEVVLFSWIEWPSRETRDQGNPKAMADPRMAAIGPENVPFDGKRMIFGGFVPLLDTASPKT